MQDTQITDEYFIGILHLTIIDTFYIQQSAWLIYVTLWKKTKCVILH
jgi:hypothetical protein